MQKHCGLKTGALLAILCGILLKELLLKHGAAEWLLFSKEYLKTLCERRLRKAVYG